MKKNIKYLFMFIISMTNDGYCKIYLKKTTLALIDKNKIDKNRRDINDGNDEKITLILFGQIKF